MSFNHLLFNWKYFRKMVIIPLSTLNYLGISPLSLIDKVCGVKHLSPYSSLTSQVSQCYSWKYGNTCRGNSLCVIIILELKNKQVLILHLTRFKNHYLSEVIQGKHFFLYFRSAPNFILRYHIYVTNGQSFYVAFIPNVIDYRKIIYDVYLIL